MVANLLDITKLTDLKGKRCLVRLDLNVPIDEYGNITDFTRIEAVIPTLKYLLAKQVKLILTSHLGRPTPGIDNSKYSLYFLLPILTKYLQRSVSWGVNWPYDFDESAEIILAENVRFLVGEVENDLVLAKTMANKIDLFVMDAFATTHRQHASTYGVANYVDKVAIGLLVKQELGAVNHLLNKAQSPVTLVIGGAKIASKMPLLEALLPLVDQVLVGGGVANTCLQAMNYNVGNSLVDIDCIDFARRVLLEDSKVVLPIDLICASNDSSPGFIVKANAVKDNSFIFDLGPSTVSKYQDIINKSATVIWAGPLGLVEHTNFSRGTKAVIEAMQTTLAFTIIGGGDTVSCVRNLLPGALTKFDVVSTGGGAFLAALQGMPKALDIIWQRSECAKEN